MSRRRTRRRARRGRKHDRTLLWVAAGGGLLWLAARGQSAQAATAQALPGVPASLPTGGLGTLWSTITGALSNVAAAAGSAFAPFVPTGDPRGVPDATGLVPMGPPDSQGRQLYYPPQFSGT